MTENSLSHSPYSRSSYIFSYDRRSKSSACPVSFFLLSALFDNPCISSWSATFERSIYRNRIFIALSHERAPPKPCHKNFSARRPLPKLMRAFPSSLLAAEIRFSPNDREIHLPLLRPIPSIGR